MEGVQGIVPAHIGIIMDGNGRWAEKRGKKRTYGHQKGSQNVDKIASHAFERGVKVVSLYAFSSENWARPKDEVDSLMKLLKNYFDKFKQKAFKNKVRIKVMGDLNGLTDELRESIKSATEKTSAFQDRTINIGVNYGSRAEIVGAVKKIVANGEEISEESIERNLYTGELPPLDLIIRTGGEMRLSNFMLYQSAYSEFYFTDVLWPDFDEKQLDLAIESFSCRKRRFGKI